MGVHRKIRLFPKKMKTSVPPRPAMIAPSKLERKVLWSLNSQISKWLFNQTKERENVAIVIVLYEWVGWWLVFLPKLVCSWFCCRAASGSNSWYALYSRTIEVEWKQISSRWTWRKKGASIRIGWFLWMEKIRSHDSYFSHHINVLVGEKQRKIGLSHIISWLSK